VSGGTVYAGGDFTTIGGLPQVGLAAIVDPSVPSVISASAGANGSISPSGAVTVPSGASQTFSIEPDACYHVADVKADGVSVGALTSYTFTDVTNNHSIGASFAVEFDGSACSDDDSCTTSETCEAGTCTGTPSAPAEADGVRISRCGGTAQITWNLAACATSSTVLRGLVSGLPVGPGGGDESCLASGLPSTTLTLTDGENPSPGDSFWYLVRGDSSGGHGPLGFQAVNGLPTVPRETTTCQ
jgi:hypothetical protein